MQENIIDTSSDLLPISFEDIDNENIDLTIDTKTKIDEVFLHDWNLNKELLTYKSDLLSIVDELIEQSGLLKLEWWFYFWNMKWKSTWPKINWKALNTFPSCTFNKKNNLWNKEWKIGSVDNLKSLFIFLWIEILEDEKEYYKYLLKWTLKDLLKEWDLKKINWGYFFWDLKWPPFWPKINGMNLSSFPNAKFNKENNIWNSKWILVTNIDLRDLCDCLGIRVLKSEKVAYKTILEESEEELKKSANIYKKDWKFDFSEAKNIDYWPKINWKSLSLFPNAQFNKANWIGNSDWRILSINQLEKLFNVLFMSTAEKKDLVSDLLSQNFEKYIWNNNQILLAKDSWISSLRTLYEIVNSLGLVEKLSYKQIRLSLKEFDLLEKELLNNSDEYIWNNNQLKLAEKIGCSDMNWLYSWISTLWFTETLWYINIKLSKDKLIALKDELDLNYKDYIWNRNQSKLALKIWIESLGALYSWISALWFTNKLNYNYINASVYDFVELERELDNFDVILKYANYETIVDKYNSNKINTKYIFNKFNRWFIDELFAKWISVSRLISYLVANTNSYLFDSFIDTLENIDEALFDLSIKEDSYVLNGFEKVLLWTYHKNILDQKQSLDLLNNRFIHWNNDFIENGSAFNDSDLLDGFISDDLNSHLERALPSDLYDNYINGEVTDELRDFIVWNEHLYELFKDYYE